jgi:hypothetical protein
MIELRKSLIEKLDFMKTKPKSLWPFELKLIYSHFDKALLKNNNVMTNAIEKIKKDNPDASKEKLAGFINDIPNVGFDKYAHKFFNVEVPSYLDNEKKINITFYYTLSDRVDYLALARKTEVLINFKTEQLLRFISSDKIIKEYIEDSVAHEITHIIDPGFNRGVKTTKRIMTAQSKADSGNYEEYFNLPWEKVAYHTQNVRRFLHNILKSKEFQEVWKTKDIQKFSSFMLDKVKSLKEYLSDKLEIVDRNKIYKEVYKEIVHMIDKYKESIEV